MSKKNIRLAGGNRSSNCVYNALKKEFEIITVVHEQGVKRTNFIKRQIKKLGFAKVVSQVFFQKIVMPFLKWSYALKNIFLLNGKLKSNFGCSALKYQQIFH